MYQLKNIYVILDVAVPKKTANLIEQYGGVVTSHATVSEPDHEWFYRGFFLGGNLVITNDVGVIRRSKKAGIHYISLPMRVSGADLDTWVLERLDEYNRAPDKERYLSHLHTVVRSQRRSSRRDREKERYPFISLKKEMIRAGVI